MATLKDISLRLKSVKNIQKITKSMKMIAAVKYSRAERELKPARPYGSGAKALYENLELTKKPEQKPDHLVVVMSSDRGLCGAIHSNISRQIRHDFGADAASPPENWKLVLIGDKARQQLGKQFGKRILFTVNEYGRKPPTFEDASAIASEIIKSGLKFSQGNIYFNFFKSVVSYKTTKLPIFSAEEVMASESMPMYDSIDDEVMRSYMEYSLANLIYYAMKEGSTSEQSSRMTAMDAASKNAGEMIDKLTLQFNRTRQAVITKELIEIISGAAAV